MGAQYDDTLMAMMRQHKDEMDFLNNIFGFLQRRTQCFNGPKAETNFQTLINTLSHQLEMYKKADVKKKGGVDEDDEEVAAKKKAGKEAEVAKKKVPPDNEHL
ncbi:hypothetical protein T484DRAFT_1753864 [Baffinella frigidus]|nr:hypothetical protein T484DRAFT_1753864 [Cryptophyta sp. CCMP2293]